MHEVPGGTMTAIPAASAPSGALLLCAAGFQSERYSSNWDSGGAGGRGGRLLRSSRPPALIHISEPTSILSISYAVLCSKKNKP